MDPKTQQESQEILKRAMDMFCETYYIEDVHIVYILYAIIFAQYSNCEPVWLMVVGGSSSGKSVLINTITDIKCVWAISTLTSNTLISGLKGQRGEETSLLHKIGNGVIAMKDFTTLLSVKRETRSEIMSQFREVYDGELTKHTGIGDAKAWKGKISLIAGTTEDIYAIENQFAEMGTRWVNYIFKKQDRKKTAKKSLSAKSLLDKQIKIKELFTEYVEHTSQHVPKNFNNITEQEEDEIINLTDFGSLARSPVKKDQHGQVKLVLSEEMPMRMARQILIILQSLKFMFGDKFNNEMKLKTYQIVLDSIPKLRKLVLIALAEHTEANAPGIASYLGYPTAPIRETLEELAAHKLCKRTKGKRSDIWNIKKEYREILNNYFNVKFINQELIGVEDTPDPDSMSEEEFDYYLDGIEDFKNNKKEKDI
jgi:hypothetical protein